MNDFTLKLWHVVVGILAIVAIYVGSLLMAPREEGVDAFGGTDAQVTEILETDHDAKPWFEPLFAPAPEVESGLFALQAAIGAGVLGFALGRLSGRKAPTV